MWVGSGVPERGRAVFVGVDAAARGRVVVSVGAYTVGASSSSAICGNTSFTTGESNATMAAMSSANNSRPATGTTQPQVSLR